MSTFTPLYDAFAAGSLANATLCSRPAKDAREHGPRFSETAADAPEPTPLVASRSTARRLLEPLVNLISGPTCVRPTTPRGQ